MYLFFHYPSIQNYSKILMFNEKKNNELNKLKYIIEHYEDNDKINGLKTKNNSS